MKRENYFSIQYWMVSELKLSGNELMAYAIIFGFTQKEDQWYNGSLSYIASFIGANKRTVLSCLARLVGKGFIEKETFIINNVTFCKYKAVTNPSIPAKNFPGGMEEISTGGMENFSTNNIVLDNIENNKEKFNKKKNEQTEIFTDPEREVPENKSGAQSSSATQTDDSERTGNPGRGNCGPGRDDGYIRFASYVAENCPNVAKIEKQVTEAEYKKLLEKFSKKQIFEIIERLDNKKGAPKLYVSVYKTVLNWLKSDVSRIETSQKPAQNKNTTEHTKFRGGVSYTPKNAIYAECFENLDSHPLNAITNEYRIVDWGRKSILERTNNIVVKFWEQTREVIPVAIFKDGFEQPLGESQQQNYESKNLTTVYRGILL